MADGTIPNSLAYSGKPLLVRDWAWSGARWSIVWEEGPYDWSLGLAGGYTETSYLIAEMLGTAPKAEPAMDTPGVLVEPVNGWAVALYPA